MNKNIGSTNPKPGLRAGSLQNLTHTRRASGVKTNNCLAENNLYSR